MGLIANINNNDTGLSIRQKINTLIGWFNVNEEAPTGVLLGRTGAGVGPISQLTSSQAKNVLQLAISDIPQLADSLNGKAALTHTHSQSNVSGLIEALALKAPLLSPDLTGTPTAPTPPSSDNSNRIATTGFAQMLIAELLGAAPELLDTFEEFAAALGNDPDFATTIFDQLASKQPLSNALSRLATISPGVDRLPYFDSTTSAAFTAFTALARTLAAINTQTDFRAAIGVPNTRQWVYNLHTPRPALTGAVTQQNLMAGALHQIEQDTFGGQNSKYIYKFLFAIDATGATTLGNITLTLKFNNTDMAVTVIPSGTTDSSVIELDVEVSPTGVSAQRVRTDRRIIDANGAPTTVIKPRLLTAAATNVDIDVFIYGQLANATDSLTLQDVEVYTQG